MNIVTHPQTYHLFGEHMSVKGQYRLSICILCFLLNFDLHVFIFATNSQMVFL